MQAVAQIQSDQARFALTSFFERTAALLTFSHQRVRTPRAVSGTFVRFGRHVAVITAQHAISAEPSVSIITHDNEFIPDAISTVLVAPGRDIDVALAVLSVAAADRLRSYALDLDQIEQSAVRAIPRDAQLVVAGFPKQFSFDRPIAGGIENGFVTAVRYIGDHRHDHRLISLNWSDSHPTARPAPRELGFREGEPTPLRKPDGLSGGGVFWHSPSPISAVWAPDRNAKLIGVAIEFKDRRELAVPWWRWSSWACAAMRALDASPA